MNSPLLPARTTVFAKNRRTMQITKAEFKCSSERISQVPKDGLKDIAFIGRSNVGKSSLINMLTARGGLAKVSGTPGKTRLVNHFRINDAWYLVDLPGYATPARRRRSAESSRNSSPTTFSSARRCTSCSCWRTSGSNPRRSTCASIEMLGENGILFAIIFTKADKLSKTQQQKSVERFRHGARRTMGGAADVRLLVGERHRARRDPRLHRRMPASELTPKPRKRRRNGRAAGAKTTSFRKCLTDC